MPVSCPRPCSYPGCPELVNGGSRCQAHLTLGTGKFGDRFRGSRQSRGYDAKWERTRKRILVRDAGICQVALKEGRIEVATEVDHVVSKAEWKRLHGSLDGVDDDSNLQAISEAAHKAKTQAEALRARGLGAGQPVRRG